MTRQTRLVLWLGFVGILIALAYSARAASGKPDPNVLYRYSSAADVTVQYAVLLAVTLGIAGMSAALLGLRRPRMAWAAAAGLAAATFVGIFVTTGILDRFLHAGREQGLTPSHWEPAHAGAYAANFVVVALVGPIVEELTYRGLGYSLLADHGTWVAIVVTAVLFGASHGLISGLPVLTIFGLGLGWLRARTDSSIPGMFVHSAFNALALTLAVVV